MQKRGKRTAGGMAREKAGREPTSFGARRKSQELNEIPFLLPKEVGVRYRDAAGLEVSKKGAKGGKSLAREGVGGKQATMHMRRTRSQCASVCY